MTATHKIALPEDMPRAMRQLPRDSVGRPVPKFVQIIDGVPDFRIMDTEFMVAAVKEKLCWTCGEALKRDRVTRVARGTFVVGPMCVINRVSAEPPSHAECAEWSAQACPFLSNPDKVRREAHMPEQVREMPGIGILRNPGVTALVDSPTWQMFRAPAPDGGTGLLFRFNITGVRWMAGGKIATASQVLHSIETGLPALRDVATEPGALMELGRWTQRAMTWVTHQEDIAKDYPLIAQTLRAAP